MLIPPYLRPNDTIAIICPSGYMPAENFAVCMEVLQHWGFRVRKGATAGHQFHYFSGTDEERLQDLQLMMDDPEVKAIFCARGGYGLSRIIDRLDFTRFRQSPKWIIGFSDVTVLHAHIHEQLGIATLHAPMAAAFNDNGFNNPYVQSLRAAITGEPAAYEVAAHPLNKKGNAAGELIGGNLAIIAHLVGSASAYQAAGKLLFLEDVGEYMYNIDRMMMQLKRCGMLQDLKGLIFGGFTDMKDTTIPFGSDIYTILHQYVADAPYPVCFDFPVSHNTENYALKVGVQHQLEVGDGGVKLREC